MKGVWVQDFDIFTQVGGAEASDRTTFMEGVRRGHDLRLALPPQVDLTGSDFVIVSNAAAWPTELIEAITQKVKTIFYLHDYWGACIHRLYYPMAERCLRRCPVSSFAETVLTKAELLVWLSPLHREAWLKKHPNLENVPHHLHPSPVDPRPFEEASKQVQKVPGTVLGVNVTAPFKGRDNVLAYAQAHPELKFTFVGGDNCAVPQNCRLEPGVASSQMPLLMAQHEALIHLPPGPAPFDRVIPEAIFSGNKLIVNDLIGSLSYGWKTKEEWKANLGASPGKFWEKVEEMVK